MFADENEINLSDEEWVKKFRTLIINMIKNLNNELKNIYENGEEGVLSFLSYNIGTLIENLIGQKYSNSFQKNNDDFFFELSQKLMAIVKNEDNKKETINKVDDKKDIDKKEEKKIEENFVTPNALTVDDIFRIAKKDKERLEKEQKEQGNKKEEQKYSEFYYLTSLFKN